MNIIICKIKYPNDPTGNLNAHQHFIGKYEGDEIELYSISKILGKEYKVYDADGNVNIEYYIIQNKERIDCQLKVPSFIDCTKSYSLKIQDNMDLSKLSNRMIPQNIVDKIIEKISEMKNNGNHTQYTINPNEFIKNNYKCIIKKENNYVCNSI